MYKIGFTALVPVWTNQSNQRTFTVGGRITVWLVSSSTELGVTKQENKLLFACTKTTESKPVKLDTSRTVILPPTASVLWSNLNILISRAKQQAFLFFNWWSSSTIAE